MEPSEQITHQNQDPHEPHTSIVHIDNMHVSAFAHLNTGVLPPGITVRIDGWQHTMPAHLARHLHCELAKANAEWEVWTNEQSH